MCSTRRTARAYTRGSPAQCPGGHRREFVVVPAGQVVADLADHFIDDEEVIEEPFLVRREGPPRAAEAAAARRQPEHPVVVAQPMKQAVVTARTPTGHSAAAVRARASEVVGPLQRAGAVRFVEGVAGERLFRFGPNDRAHARPGPGDGVETTSRWCKPWTGRGTKSGVPHDLGHTAGRASHGPGVVVTRAGTGPARQHPKSTPTRQPTPRSVRDAEQVVAEAHQSENHRPGGRLATYRRRLSRSGRRPAPPSARS